MTTPVIAFFNNKGGVGKTSLVYHLAWMMADQGHRVVAVDFDPQANLTSAFLDEDQVEGLWNDNAGRRTVWGAIRPLADRTGPLGTAPLATTSDFRLALLPGDLQLSTFEDSLSAEWPLSMNGNAGAFAVMSTFWRLTQDAADQHDADVVLVDVGPSLGAINRAALLASNHVVLPVAPDLFSLQGLRNLGPTLDDWRRGWRDRLERKPASVVDVPAGEMNVLGYVVLQHGVRLDRPVRAYQRWMDQIPGQFQVSVLGGSNEHVPRMDEDPYCLGQLKHYHSLMPLAREARKPIFALTAADGALGGHFQAARDAYGHFDQLAKTILRRAGIVA
ncbi:MAG TPA: ParA family protein [Kutzneria sp.]|nr:ParA family protein [Kutzneria sp.]